MVPHLPHRKARPPLQESSYYAGLPFLCGFAATWLGGIITDYLTRRFDARRGRLIWAAPDLLLTGTLMSAGVLSPRPRAAALLMAIAAGTIDLYLGAAWSSAVDIGGRSGGAAAGLMNAASNCAGFASPALMGWVLQRTNNWNIVLVAGIVSTFLAVYLWMRVNSPPPIRDPECLPKRRGWNDGATFQLGYLLASPIRRLWHDPAKILAPYVRAA